jgi:hypothetical protein
VADASGSTLQAFVYASVAPGAIVRVLSDEVCVVVVSDRGSCVAAPA